MRIVLVALVIATVIAAPAMAHHSFAMFDMTKTVTWVGTVEEFAWTNPHVHITVLVPPSKEDPTMAGKWDIEGASPNIMSRQGWSKLSFKPGDKITIVGHPARDGRKFASLYYAIGKDGKKLYHDVNRTGGPSGIPPEAQVPKSH
jgi:hypothetical protein